MDGARVIRDVRDCDFGLRNISTSSTGATVVLLQVGYMSSKKRSLSSSSPSKSPKKAKSGALDAFFRPKQTQIELDAALARQLAEEDAREAAESGATTFLSTQGQSKLAAIVIDVSDDDDAQVSSSSRQATKPHAVNAATFTSPPASNVTPSSPSRTIAKDFGPARKAAVVSEAAPVYPDMGEDPLKFDSRNCPWPSHLPTPYSFLAHVLSQLSSTRSRILMLNTLTNALRLLIIYDPPAIVPALYMVSNTLSPSYVPTELAVGPKILSSALQSISGLSSAALRKVTAYTSCCLRPRTHPRVAV